MAPPPDWQPYRESPRTTLLRNGIIALVVGTVLAVRSGGGLARWPAAALLALWPALGGHFVELAFLNGLRPRISARRGVQVGARILIWFVGGCLLVLAMKLTAIALGGFNGQWWRGWWIGGLAFIGIELVVHLALKLRGLPSFYDGRG